MKSLTQYINDRPIKIKLLFFFLPLIIFSVIFTGACSYHFAETQLLDNTYYLLRDTTYQTNTLLNDQFLTMFEQLFFIEENPAFQNMILNQYEANPKQQYLDIISINNHFNDIYQKYNKVVDSIYINLNNEHEFQLMNESVPIKIGVNLNAWLSKYHGSRENYYWLNDHTDSIFTTCDKRRVISCFKIIGTKTSKAKGLLIINLKSNYFLEILRNVRVSNNGYLVLVSPDGEMFSKNVAPGFRMRRTNFAHLRRKSESGKGYFVKSDRGKKLYVVYNTLNINRWIIAAVVPESDLLIKVRKIRDITLVISIALSFLSIILALVFSGTITASIKYLSKQVKTVECGNFDTQFVVKEKNEIGVLANGLTSLVSTVKQLLHKVREEQEEKRRMELLALQSQINPHFLYNTLGSIKHLIDMQETKKASTMVSALTKFFMIGISKGREIITVKEEIEHVRNYLLIQQMRYCKDFEFQVDIDDEIFNCEIIKLSLQPLVENSIYHGIKNKLEKGIIRISGYRLGKNAIIEIYDDGPGIEKLKLNRICQSINAENVEEKPMTFGLRNVHQRLRLHFGSEYGLSIISKINQFTCIRVKIPFLGDTNGGNWHESSMQNGAR